MADIVVNDRLVVSEADIREDFVRSSGPGGQNVNKVSTSVQLQFDIAASGLPEGVKNRLEAIAGGRIDRNGALRIEARRFRTRELNRKDARRRLVELIAEAAEPPKPRTKTRPTRGSKERRLEHKGRQSRKKKLRGRVAPSDD